MKTEWWENQMNPGEDWSHSMTRCVELTRLIELAKLSRGMSSEEIFPMATYAIARIARGDQRESSLSDVLVPLVSVPVSRPGYLLAPIRRR